MVTAVVAREHADGGAPVGPVLRTGGHTGNVVTHAVVTDGKSSYTQDPGQNDSFTFDDTPAHGDRTNHNSTPEEGYLFITRTKK
jgi:hypothetical protein